MENAAHELNQRLLGFQELIHHNKRISGMEYERSLEGMELFLRRVLEPDHAGVEEMEGLIGDDE